MLLSITHIDILFKIPTNKLITRNYNTFCNLYLYKTNMIENNKLVLVKEIRKSYYDSIIDQKKVFSEIEENSKCKIIQ